MNDVLLPIPIRILLVDDHVLFREGLISMLRNEADIDVVGQAGTAKAALDAALQLQPDLILMDITLPDGDGIDLTKEILCQLPKTKIVILTIYDTRDLLISAVLAGARGYLIKNMPIFHVLASLRAVARGEMALSRYSINEVVDELVRLARMQMDQRAEYENGVELTPREVEVLHLLGEDASNRDIAERLFIAENTVKIHVSRVLNKLNCKTRSEAGRFARRYSYAQPETQTIQKLEDKNRL